MKSLMTPLQVKKLTRQTTDHFIKYAFKKPDTMSGFFYGQDTFFGVFFNVVLKISNDTT